MAMAAARFPGPGSGPMARWERIFRRRAAGRMSQFSPQVVPVRQQQQTKWSQRVEPEKEREIQDARFTACQ